MIFTGFLIAALSIAQEARANPVAKHYESPADHEPYRAEITPPPKAVYFWSKPALNLDEFALLNGESRVGKRQDSDLLRLCGSGYVDCGNSYCCPAGNTCFTDSLTNSIKCNPTTFDFGNLGQSTDFSDLVKQYSSILEEYSGLLSGFSFPSIALTGSFDYSSFLSSYYSALGAFTATSDIFGGLLVSAAASKTFAYPTETAATATGAGETGTAGASTQEENSNGSSVTKNKKKKTNLGPIIGGVVGGVVVLALIAGIIIFLLLKNKKKKKAAMVAGAGAGATSASPPSSAEPAKPSAYVQQSAPAPVQYPPVGQPPMAQYGAPVTSPAPTVSPVGVMGGLPAVPQPGQFQQTPSPGSQHQYGQYAPPPAFSPPPPSASPVPVASAAVAHDPSKTYYSSPPAQYAEMPGQGYPPPQQQPPQQYQQVPAPGFPQPQGQPPYNAQPQQQGPIAEMDGSGR